MFTRVALFAASLAASAVLAVGLALFGLAPAVPAGDPAVVPAAATASDQPTQPVTLIDTVYVVPATPTPTPEPTPTPIIVKRVVTTGGGEHEGGDDH
jgi:hypothetical protein